VRPHGALQTGQAVSVPYLRSGIQKLGKSQRSKDMTKVASVAAYRDGKLLFGRRNDNGKWTLPGGGLEPGEDPKRGAVRELLEESSMKPKTLEFLGEMTIHDGQLQVFAFRCEVEGEPSGDRDPDGECAEWRFVDPDNIPDEIMNNLHSKKNVTLKLLGLQDWDEAPLTKAETSNDEVLRLLQHPNIAEARMAIKLNGAKASHLVEAVRRCDLSLTADALSHAQANSHVLSEVASDPASATTHLHQLTAHPLFDGKHALKLAQHAASGRMSADDVAQTLASNQHAGPDSIASLLPVVGHSHAASLLLHPNATESEFRQFFGPYVNQPQTADSLTANQSIESAFLDSRMPEEFIRSLAAYSFANRFDAGHDFAAMAFRHPKLPPEFANKLVAQLPVRPDFTTQHIELLKNPALSSKHLDAFLRAKNPTIRALASRHPNVGHDQASPVSWEPVQKFEEATEVWLAKMAFAPKDFGGIRKQQFLKKTNHVDAAPLMTAHPPEVEHLKKQYEGLRDSATLHEPTLRNVDGVTPKLIYLTKNGDTPVRAMVKPFFEKPPKQLAAVYPHPTSGWAELTNQALYHAAGIGDLHQKVHASDHDEQMGMPAVVVHLEAGHSVVGKHTASHWLKQSPQLKTQARKIAFMDFLSSNYDRHSKNLMVNSDHSKLLAIDHGFSFQYMMPTLRYPDDSYGPPAEEFANTYNKATRSVAGDLNLSEWSKPEELTKAARNFAPVFDWWSQVGDNVRAKMHQHLQYIKDQTLKDHIRDSFDRRANWLDQMSKTSLSARPLKWMHERVEHRRFGEAVTPGVSQQPAAAPAKKKGRA